MTEAVVRLRAPLVENRYGGTDKDWDNASRLVVAGCECAPRVEGEDITGGREGVVIGWDIYTPPDVDIAPTDRVEVRGVAHDVDGQPADWSSGFSTWEPGIHLRLRRVEG